MVNRLVVAALATVVDDDGDDGGRDATDGAPAAPVIVNRLVVVAFGANGIEAFAGGAVEDDATLPLATPVMVNRLVVVLRTACAWATP